MFHTITKQRQALRTYLKEIVYGGNDGIVTTFAVIAGFTAANTNNLAIPLLTVLLFGFANLFADAASMGLGNFLSLRSEKDVYTAEKSRERRKVQTAPDEERHVTKAVLQTKGFSEDQAEKLTAMYATNESYWIEWLMHYKKELPNPTNENPFLTGLATFIAFLIFGFIPLIPYILATPGQDAFLFSAVAGAGGLTFLGLLRWKLTDENIFRSVFEHLIIGGAAASIAYIVGSFFKL